MEARGSAALGDNKTDETDVIERILKGLTDEDRNSLFLSPEDVEHLRNLRESPEDKVLKELSLRYEVPKEIEAWDNELQKELSARINDDSELRSLSEQYKGLKLGLNTDLNVQMQDIAGKYSKKIAAIFAETYGIEPPEVTIQAERGNRRGEYSPGQVSIFFDPYMKLSDIRETAVHELRHHLQHCIELYSESFGKLEMAQHFRDTELASIFSTDKRIAEKENWTKFCPRNIPPDLLPLLREYGEALQTAGYYYEYEGDAYTRNIIERNAREDGGRRGKPLKEATAEITRCLEEPFNRASKYFNELYGVYSEESFVSRADLEKLLEDDSISRRWALLPPREQLDLMAKAKEKSLRVLDFNEVLGRFDQNVFDHLQTIDQFEEWMSWLSADQRENLGNLAKEGTFFSILSEEFKLKIGGFSALESLFGVDE